MRRVAGRVLAAVVLFGAVLAGSASLPSGPATAATPTLRQLADAAGVRIGGTLDPGEIGTLHSDTLAREFNSLTAENAMKWYTIQPTRGVFDFTGGDAVLGFAEANAMTVRGHNLVWAQDQFTPAWVKAIADPTELRQVVHDHIATVLNHYRGRITRWDVVNEPLSYTANAPSDSVFQRVLGPDWLVDVYTDAHSVDPTIELWLNETLTDWVPGKHAAMLDLVRGLQAAGVPLYGIGIQTHRPSVEGPDRAVYQQMLQDVADLGLKVAVTELDVPTAPTDPDAFARQAEAYRTIVTSCLAVAACEEVTTWGVGDASTWLDHVGYLATPTRPLLFDDDYQPKPAYWAVAEVLAAGRPQPAAPSTTSTAPPAAVAVTPAFTG